MSAEDVAAAVASIASLSAHIDTIELMPVAQSFAAFQVHHA